MTAQICFVGEANPYGTDPDMALYPLPERASGHRLAEIVGLPNDVYLDDAIVARRNLCPQDWSAKIAKGCARVILMQQPAPIVVALGVKVAAAFASVTAYPKDPILPFETRKSLAGLTTVLHLPHPSGLNALWRAPGAVERARKILRALCPAVPWGSRDADSGK